jgi:hypothetical protein
VQWLRKRVNDEETQKYFIKINNTPAIQVVLFEYRFQVTQCLMLIPMVIALNPPKASYMFSDRHGVNRSRN